MDQLQQLSDNQGKGIKQDNNLWIGKTITDRYKITEKLGEGSSGKVFKIYDTQEQENRVVKIIKKSQGYDQYQKQKREIAVLKSFAHENIVKMYESFEQGENIFLIFEYCDLGPLEMKQVLEKEAVIIFLQMVRAFKYIHENYKHKTRFIHRDIKFSNFCIKKANNRKIIKLIDFGLARFIDLDNKLEPITRCGTENFNAPEIRYGNAPDINEKVDIYSLGVMLYYMLYGKFPYNQHYSDEELKQVEKSQREKIEQAEIAIKKRPPDFKNSSYNTCKSLKTLITKMLDYSPQTRISFEELFKNKFAQVSIKELENRNILVFSDNSKHGEKIIDNFQQILEQKIILNDNLVTDNYKNQSETFYNFKFEALKHEIFQYQFQLKFQNTAIKIGLRRILNKQDVIIISIDLSLNNDKDSLNKLLVNWKESIEQSIILKNAKIFIFHSEIQSLETKQALKDFIDQIKHENPYLYVTCENIEKKGKFDQAKIQNTLQQIIDHQTENREISKNITQLSNQQFEQMKIEKCCQLF